jgi:hypothetical protein
MLQRTPLRAPRMTLGLITCRGSPCILVNDVYKLARRTPWQYGLEKWPSQVPVTRCPLPDCPIAHASHGREGRAFSKIGCEWANKQDKIR